METRAEPSSGRLTGDSPPPFPDVAAASYASMPPPPLPKPKTFTREWGPWVAAVAILFVVLAVAAQLAIKRQPAPAPAPARTTIAQDFGYKPSAAAREGRRAAFEEMRPHLRLGDIEIVAGWATVEADRTRWLLTKPETRHSILGGFLMMAFDENQNVRYLQVVDRKTREAIGEVDPVRRKAWVGPDLEPSP